jgi:CheY-like chemotaxis protein
MIERLEEASWRAALSPERDRFTVLVVDDDPSALSLLRTMFAENGCRVLEATNGREALAAKRRHAEIDLIVSDIDMPEMDGLEMCRWLALDGDCPMVIIVSGMEIDAATVYAAARAVIGFFPKPFRATELLQTALGVMAS